MKPQGGQTPGELPTLQRVVTAVLLATLALPFAYIVSARIVFCRPDYDFDGSGGKNYTGTTTFLLDLAIFPALLMTTSLPLRLLRTGAGFCRSFLPRCTSSCPTQAR